MTVIFLFTDSELGTWNPGEEEADEALRTTHSWEWWVFNGQCIIGRYASGSLTLSSLMLYSWCSLSFKSYSGIFLILTNGSTTWCFLFGQTVMRLMTQCNEKGFELEVNTYIKIVLLLGNWTQFFIFKTIQILIHSILLYIYIKYYIANNSHSFIQVTDAFWLSLQIKSADNRVLQEQLQTKVNTKALFSLSIYLFPFQV